MYYLYYINICISSVSVGGTALSTSDYTVNGQTVTIPANKVTGNVVINVSTTLINTGGGSGDGGNTGGDTGGGSGDGGNTGGDTPSDDLRTTTNSHANVKSLPGSYNITSDTNLIGLIPQTDNQYYLSSGWGSASDISCITFPVIPGDRISGVTLGTKSENGSSIDGTRVTYLNNDTIVTSVPPATIYNEYKANGYITVPADVNCVSIPFTKSAVDSKKGLYLLTI